MEKSNVLQKSLWANVIFAELSAIAFLFLRGKLPVIDELANGQPVLFGIELVVIAGLATYAALRPEKSKFLVRIIVGLNVVLFGYLLETLLLGPTVSAIATEALIIDVVIVAALIVGQVIGIRATAQNKNTVLVS